MAICNFIFFVILVVAFSLADATIIQPHPDCSVVRCKAAVCEENEKSITPLGQCCPICVPQDDCSSALCTIDSCPPNYHLVVPEGECCGRCEIIDKCFGILCAIPLCTGNAGPVVPEGECCPKCPPDCSAVLCLRPDCPIGQTPVTPEGECCPKCKPDCSAVLCFRPDCPIGQTPVTPEGECCPKCKDDCSANECPGTPVCRAGEVALVPKGECCPRCVCEIEGQTFSDCASACPRTCRAQCRPGCQCPGNEVIDEENKRCVPLEKCPSDPCNLVDCQANSLCKIFEPTGEPFCEPSCSINNGGCPSGQICSLEVVQCVRAPCPRVVRCTDPCDECTSEQTCRLRVAPCLIPPCPEFAECLEPEEVCSQPADPGPCRALILRFFFNAASKQCERFMYGGCIGNENNFETLEECENKCEALPTVSPCALTSCPNGFRCEVFQNEAFCRADCGLNNGGCLANQTCRLEDVVCARAPCFPIRICEDRCPPTCTKEFCSKRRNRRTVVTCSNPGPRENPGCTGQCQLSHCKACYVEEEAIFPPPGSCALCNLTDYTSNTDCYRTWSRCIYQAHRREYGRVDYTSDEKLRCYNPPCPLRG